jgi:hypothetical protein
MWNPNFLDVTHTEKLSVYFPIKSDGVCTSYQCNLMLLLLQINWMLASAGTSLSGYGFFFSYSYWMLFFNSRLLNLLQYSTTGCVFLNRYRSLVLFSLERILSVDTVMDAVMENEMLTRRN